MTCAQRTRDVLFVTLAHCPLWQASYTLSVYTRACVVSHDSDVTLPVAFQASLSVAFFSVHMHWARVTTLAWHYPWTFRPVTHCQHTHAFASVTTLTWHYPWPFFFRPVTLCQHIHAFASVTTLTWHYPWHSGQSYIVFFSVHMHLLWSRYWRDITHDIQISHAMDSSAYTRFCFGHDTDVTILTHRPVTIFFSFFQQRTNFAESQQVSTRQYGTTAI